MPLVGGLHVISRRAGLALPPTSAGRISMFSVAWFPDPLAAGNDAGSHLDARRLGLRSHRAAREDGRVPEIAVAVIRTDGCPEIAVAVNRTDGGRTRPRYFERTGAGKNATAIKRTDGDRK